MGITYEALFSSRGTKLGAPASSLRSEGAYEDRRPVPNPVSLLEEFGIERRQREAPALCDPLSVTVLSWATACFQGALPQCPALLTVGFPVAESSQKHPLLFEVLIGKADFFLAGALSSSLCGVLPRAVIEHKKASASFWHSCFHLKVTF